MRFRLPRGCGRVSHAGNALPIAPDGSIEADATAVALLEPHGVVPLGDPAPVDRSRIDTMASADLVAALAARGILPPVSASPATLRGLLRQALAKPILPKPSR